MNSASGPVSCKTGQCWLRDNLGKEGNCWLLVFLEGWVSCRGKGWRKLTCAEICLTLACWRRVRKKVGEGRQLRLEGCARRAMRRCSGTRIWATTGVKLGGGEAEVKGGGTEWPAAADLVSQMLHVNVILTSDSSPFLLLYLAWGNCFFFILWAFFPFAGANGNCSDTPSPPLFPLWNNTSFLSAYMVHSCVCAR